LVGVPLEGFGKNAPRTKMPTTNPQTDRDEASDHRGDHPKNGMAYWLCSAPSWATFAEVNRAADEHDDPDEVWVADDPTDHRLKRVPGPLDGVECVRCGARRVSVDEFHAVPCRRGDR
jgi:hypothetical protein